MKAKKIGSILLIMVLMASLAGCVNGGQRADSKEGFKESRAGGKRVCFISRASADTFAAWLTKEMKAAAKNIRILS